MSWNYRVVRRVVAVAGTFEVSFAVHEAYYHAPGDERPHSITVDPVSPSGATVEELRESMVRYADALSKPVLDHDGPWEA